MGAPLCNLIYNKVSYIFTERTVKVLMSKMIDCVAEFFGNNLRDDAYTWGPRDS